MNMKWRIAFSFIGFFMSICIFLPSFGCADENSIIYNKNNRLKPDPSIQSMIISVSSMMEDENEKGFYQQLEKLKAIDNKKLIPQLLYYKMKTTGTMEAMLPAVIIDQLNISKKSIIEVLTPYLETNDDKLKKEIKGWISNKND